MSKLLRTLCLTFILCISCVSWANSQSSTATLTGTVEDEKGAVVPGANVTIVNDGTGARRNTTTNQSGAFTFSLLPPSTYTVTVEHTGFGSVQFPNVVLNVGDQKALQVQLKVGDVNAQIEVRPDASLVRTDGSVGNVIDRQFVKNLPLNGRSFQSLLELTPGIVLVPTGPTGTGQFSVNGQRSNANVFLVDGVNANAGAPSSNTASFGQEASGQMPSLTAQGSTAALVPVDALEEFRVQTSSYAAEFGRQPGGQISLVTRSGGNEFHGTLYDFVRNEALDANDWFANRSGLKRPPTRQHQFGGTISGPIYFPRFGDGGKRIYNGKDRTFFFFNYEGLRLQLPKTMVISVPTLCFRGAAPCPVGRLAALPQVHSILSAYPIPNGAEFIVTCNRSNAGNDPTTTDTLCTPNSGTTGAGTKPSGFALFSATYADPSTYDSTAIRIDHNFKGHVLFGRFSNTPSTASVRTAATVRDTSQNNRIFTVGLTSTLSSKLINDLRANYTTNAGPVTNRMDTFGGATPLTNFGFVGSDPANSFYSLLLSGALTVGIPALNWGNSRPFVQRQFNIVNNISYSMGNHQLKFGLDYRRSNPEFQSGKGSRESLQFQNLDFLMQGNPVSGRITRYNLTMYDGQEHAIVFNNFSAYGQDTWSVNRRLTLTYGLRWELVPPPYTNKGGELPAILGLENPTLANNLTIAPAGTPLWETRYFNFAPRFGASFVVSEKQGHELIVRGGGGIFYDLGVGDSAVQMNVWPFAGFRGYPQVGNSDPTCAANTTFPLPACALVPLPTGLASVPTNLYLLDRKIKMPRTYQWNVSVEQALGRHQSITMSYVGAAGRDLIGATSYAGLRVTGITYPGSTTTFLRLQTNKGYSDYQSLQFQFQRRLTRGLQALANYTYSRSKDTESRENPDTGVPVEAVPVEDQYGYSSFDLRHNFTAAVTYEIPKFKSNRFLEALGNGWGLDAIFKTRSAFPVSITTFVTFPQPFGPQPVTPDVVAGQPFWVEDQSSPGGRRINRAAFADPSPGTVGNLPRGAVRGFGMKQIDLSLRREFGFGEKTRLQLRIDAFNAFNMPNFADPSIASLSFVPATFGQPTQMLNRGLGGLSALYQSGGPRSMQGSVKIIF